MKRFGFLTIGASLFAQMALAQVGLFENEMDIGDPSIPGMASFDNGTYNVDGIGVSIDDKADQFHFVYSEMSGSFAIEAFPFPLEDFGRGGIMIRQDLDPDSAHVSFLMTSTPSAGANATFGSVFPTFRTVKGGGTVRDGDPTPNPGGFDASHTGPIRLERIGNSVHYYTFNDAGEWVWIQEEIAPMDGTIYAGLAATGEGENNLGIYEYTDVAMEELPLYVARTLPNENFSPGISYNPVTLTASARAGQTVILAVTERAPALSAVSNVQASRGQAVNNGDGSITWTVDNFSGEATLTYNVTLRNSPSVAWQGTFTDGVNRESHIGGVAVLPKIPSFMPLSEPVPVSLDGPTIIQAEFATPINDPQFGFLVDPRIPSGIALVHMGGGGQLEFALDVPEDGIYYFFGKARGEDGNSDSFHTEIDIPPAGTNATRWDSGGGKNFHYDWVSSTDPSQNPREFFLAQGVNFFLIQGREDSASLDLIGIDIDPGLDFATLDELAGVGGPVSVEEWALF